MTAVLVIAALLALMPLVDGSPMPEPDPTPEPEPVVPPTPPILATDVISAFTTADDLARRAIAARQTAEGRLAAMVASIGSVFQIDQTVSPPEVTVFTPTTTAPGFA